MKKLLVSVLAIAGLVACTTDDVVRVQQGGAIAFDTFVENATRVDNVSTTTDNISEFSVWAYMNAADGIVFNDELVSRNGDAWTYTNLQYWLAGNSYSFAAFAGDRDFVEGLPEGVAMDEKGLGTITFTNENGTNDILYAQNYVASAAADQDPVSFQFDHLLSKVRFTFANGFANDNNFIVVKNIKMTSAEVAQLNLNTASFAYVADAEYVWENHAGTKALDFGHMAAGEKVARGKNAISDEDRLVIPAGAEYSYTVTFDVEVYNGEQRGLEKSMEVKVSGVELVAGHSYNFVATINQENLNLNAIEFIVAVDTWEEFEYNGGAVEDEVRFVSSVAELQDILDAATGNTSVVLGADLAGNVTVPELNGATIAINGNGHKFDGTFALVGGSTYGKGTTVFEGINFETAALNGYDAFIYCNEQNGNTRYPDNVTIKNCTFKGTDTAVAAKFRSLNGNLVVENCQAEGIHSMLQLLSCGEASVLVDGVEVVDCGRGFSLQNSTNIIRNTNVKAASYGVRLEGGAAATNIENSTIEATQPVIVRKLTTAGYTVNVDDATVLTTTEPYQVVFTKGSDDAAYVAPEVAFTFNGPEDLVVFPLDEVSTPAATADELNAALAAATPGSTIELTGDDYGTITLGELKDVTLEGNNAATVVFATDANTKLENVTIKAMEFVYDGSNTNCGVVINASAQIENLVIEDCSFAGTGAKAGRGIYGQNPNATIVLKGCTFANMGYPVYTMAAGGYKSLEVLGCTFEAIKSWAIMPQYNDYQGDLTVDGCTFTNCTGGLVKAGAFTAGHTFTFTNNTITNSSEHPSKNWFTINTTAATAVVSGNTRDGAAWTPGAAEGLN